MINTQTGTPELPIPVRKIPDSSEEEKAYSQEDIDLLEERFREKEKLLKKFTDPANPLLEQYKRSLLVETSFAKEKIVYDPTVGKWKLVKEEREK